MIIQRIWLLANDHPEDLASCKWSSSRSSHLQMIICLPHHPNYLSKDPESISRTFLEQFALVLNHNNLKTGYHAQFCSIFTPGSHVQPVHNLEQQHVSFWCTEAAATGHPFLFWKDFNRAQQPLVLEFPANTKTASLTLSWKWKYTPSLLSSPTRTKYTRQPDENQKENPNF